MSNLLDTLTSNAFSLRQWCMQLSTRRSLLFVFALGLINAFTMPPAYASWLYLFTLPLFLWTLEGQTNKKSAFLCGWAFGAGFFVLSLYWVNFALFIDFQSWWWVLPLSALIGPSLLGLYTGLACLPAQFLKLKESAFVLATIITLIFSEWLRSTLFTGFPWNLPGYTWINHLSMAQNLSWAGIYGLSLLTFLWFSILGYLPHFKSKMGKIIPIVLICSFAICFVYGALRLKESSSVKTTSIAMRIVQPNILQKEKWLDDKRWGHFLQLIELSQQPSSLPDKITHYIWPETAITFPLHQAPAAKQMISEVLTPNDGILLSGNLHYTDQIKGSKAAFYNSLISIDQTGQPIDYFHKFHLVPFGEYIPFRDYISIGAIGSAIANASDFTAGDGPYNITLPNTPAFSSLICYEVIFSGKVNKAGTRPQWMLNTTNDGWYGHTAGPYQHLAISQARAIEEGTSLIRAANTGISAVISPYGRIVKQLPLGEIGNIDFYLPKPLHSTAYTVYKNYFYYFISLLLFTFACIQNKRA